MNSNNFLLAYRFIAVGMINTIIGLTIIYSSMYFFGLSPEVSNLVGYLIGFVLGYFLNKNWTFKENNAGDRWSLYVIVILAAYFSNLYLVHFSTKHLAANPYFAQFGGMLIYTAMSFVGCKKIVFVRSGRDGSF